MSTQRLQNIFKGYKSIDYETTGTELQSNAESDVNDDVEDDGIKKDVKMCGPLISLNALMDAFEENTKKFVKRNKRTLTIFMCVVVSVCYLSYVIAACILNFGRARVLLYLTIIAVVCILYSIIKRCFGEKIMNNILLPIQLNVVDRYWKIIKWTFVILFILFILTWLIYDVALEEPSRLISIAGMLVFTFIGFAFSTHRNQIIWRPVLWGFVLQFVFGLLIIRTDIGFQVFKWLGDRVTIFLGCSSAGSDFLFPKLTQFAFTTLPVIAFFSAFVYIMWYVGIIQILIAKIGWLLEITLATSPGESFNAAGNIFIGMIEAPLLIKPFLENMTESELHAVMTGGFATIAGSVLGIYIHFGVSAPHLLSASIMSAPAALAMSKLMCPEVEEAPVKGVDDIKVEKVKGQNVFEVISEGASISITIIANIMVNLIAFLSLLKCINLILGWLGSMVGVAELSFEFISSYVFMPFAYVMGVSWKDSFAVAELLGVKTFINEFVAYQRLSVYIKNREGGIGETISVRSEVITTYALCGFANFGSIGIMLGGLSSLVPSKRGIIAKHVLRAMIAGTLACFMTACVAGVLYKEIPYGTIRGNYTNATVSPFTMTVMNTANITLNKP